MEWNTEWFALLDTLGVAIKGPQSWHMSRTLSALRFSYSLFHFVCLALPPSLSLSLSLSLIGINMGEAAEMFYSNGFSKTHHDSDQILSNQYHENSSWFEEEIDVDLKWSFAINR